MPVNKITASQFADILVDSVNQRDPSLDTRIDAVRDLFIDPMSGVLEQVNDRIVYVSNLLSLKYVNKIVPDDLDDLVYNEGIIRWNGSRSVTILTFSRTQPPLVDIVIPINFPVATAVDPTTGLSIVFKTIESVTMFASAPSAYYNAETEKYEIEVAAASIVVGINTNVGAYTITNPRRPLVGIDEIFNKYSTESGRGTETNRELADRYLLHVSGSQLGSPDGMKRFVLDNFGSIIDAYVVYGENEFLEREMDDAGAVDIWVLGNSPLTRTYTVSYPGVETLIKFDRQPLVRVISVSDGSVTYVEGVDYVVVFDEDIYSRSNRCSDGIKFLTTGSVPVINAPLTIIYEYNSIINVLTSFFTQPEYYSMSSNVLYRWAKQKNIQIEANLKIRSGNPTIVAEAVRNSINSYINGLRLGEDVEEFDIDSVVSRVYGVDNWVYSTLSVVDDVGVSDIIIAPYEYARISNANLVINIV